MLDTKQEGWWNKLELNIILITFLKYELIH